jgi:hypothetical protein
VVANAAPRQGDVYLRFDGQENYVEIPSTADYSVATTGELAIAAWIRPDTLNFPRWERTGYVHWFGPVRLGTRDRRSFFQGGVSRVRIWNRVLGADEVSALYVSDAVPSSGLVAEFLLNADTGTTATDTARRNDGSIFGAAWEIQR